MSDDDYEFEEDMEDEYEEEGAVRRSSRTERKSRRSDRWTRGRGDELDVNAPLGEDDEEDEENEVVDDEVDDGEDEVDEEEADDVDEEADEDGEEDEEEADEDEEVDEDDEVDDDGAEVSIDQSRDALEVKFKFADKQQYTDIASSSPTPFESEDFDEEEGEDEDDEEVVSKPDPAHMTERQREKYLGETGELMSLAEKPKKKKKTLNADELQLHKLEQARKRKNFSIRRLEMEKRDTLNKLLMKRADKVRNLDKLKGQEYGDEEEEVQRRPQLDHPALFRWTSRTVNMGEGKNQNVEAYSIHDKAAVVPRRPLGVYRR